MKDSEQVTKFMSLAKLMGVVTPLSPQSKHYCGVGIMGAASNRAESRVKYFTRIKENIACDSVWALTGNRELSKGLDTLESVDAVAQYIVNCELSKTLNLSSVVDTVTQYAGRPSVQYVTKAVGTDSREFASGITETMMLNYFVQKFCSNDQVKTVDSDKQIGHWRATAQQSASDIATILIKSILEGKVKTNSDDKTYHFMVVAEQPYAGRMARQVNRAFLAEINNKGNPPISLIVEGCGDGITNASLDTLTRINSELAALNAERYHDARIRLQKENKAVLRDPKIMMFTTRDSYYNSLSYKYEVTLSFFCRPEGDISISIAPALNTLQLSQ